MGSLHSEYRFLASRSEVAFHAPCRCLALILLSQSQTALVVGRNTTSRKECWDASPQAPASFKSCLAVTFGLRNMGIGHKIGPPVPRLTCSCHKPCSAFELNMSTMPQQQNPGQT
ncbi:uncharacterized protein K460DRAFT_169990 [Cucurbitaria berberidis CBS 394.84]|uniref:Uncharacterized protein n=1 Tax=Cucurbitaria berberidis CBS 394.84 TaxID=1168544 RepID=A0A9P4G9T1_9PLEO|nr:uncharacterized protein K460DRAFT_169990 [Cucurbitaria berberidis CBS 394.84]KAF1841604.1 hypothetical protein K460DRAFT_169990 [Cucurbitaria berberidis CBS 394.84]